VTGRYSSLSRMRMAARHPEPGGEDAARQLLAVEAWKVETQEPGVSRGLVRLPEDALPPAD
jgi:hypothetical protein